MRLNLATVRDTVIEAGRQIVKTLRLGKSDVRTSIYASSFGEDAQPLPGMKAIFAQTESNKKSYIIGFINENAVADLGEKRIYSLDSNGNEVAFIHLKNDGEIYLGGDADFLTRFNALESGFNELRDDFNTHTHPTAPVGPVSPPSVPSTASIAGAKIDTIKTR